MTPDLIPLSPYDLALASLLVLLLAGLSAVLRLRLAGDLLIAALRTVLQLLLVGLVLKAVFASVELYWIVLIAVAMWLIATREMVARQTRRLRGWWSYALGGLSLFVSAFAVTGFALLAVIGNRPWYAPQYAIPLMGMLIGNTMTGIALALDRLNAAAWEQRDVIEGRLMLGFAASDAVAPLRREAARAGLMPAINAMAVAGLVFLPGTMTGQILAGAPPMEAVKYQILIMLIYAAGTGFGVIIAIWLGARRLFDARQRLRLERLLTAE